MKYDTVLPQHVVSTTLKKKEDSSKYIVLGQITRKR